jgi:hypothetical protein
MSILTEEIFFFIFSEVDGSDILSFSHRPEEDHCQRMK